MSIGNTSHSLVYTTINDEKQAKLVCQKIIESRLAACVNIIDNIQSVYRWEGKINCDKEMILLAKTESRLVGKLIKKIESLHSYTCPCIIAIPIIDGHQPFLDWISDATQEKVK